MTRTNRYPFILPLAIGLWMASVPLLAQFPDCGCTVGQVRTNTVVPCDLVIGSVDTIATTNELYNAINQLNASGGYRTLLLKDGTYPIASPSWYPYLTAGHFVIRSLSGNRDAVVLTGTGMKSVSPDVENVLYVVGNRVTIADLTIRSCGNHGIAVEGDSLFVHNVHIQDTYEQMVKGTAGGDGADDGLFQCSLLEYPAGIGPQFYIGGLDIHKGDRWIVRDNVFIDIASPSGSLAEHAVHFWNDGSANTVERNWILNCDRGIGFGLGTSPNTGGTIRNNMIWNDGQHPFHDVGIGLETSPGTQVYHNTVFIEYPNAIEYRFPATTDVDIANNLTNRTIKARDGATATLTANLTDATSTWFADAGSGDLHLAGLIPEVVDQGMDLTGVVAVDLDQESRPKGPGFDPGAHEFLQASAIWTGTSPSSLFRLAPNPASERFQVIGPEGTVVRVILLDVFGRPVRSWSGVRTGEPLSLAGIPQGRMWCRVETAEGKSWVQPLLTGGTR